MKPRNTRKPIGQIFLLFLCRIAHARSHSISVSLSPSLPDAGVNGVLCMFACCPQPPHPTCQIQNRGTAFVPLAWTNVLRLATRARCETKPPPPTQRSFSLSLSRMLSLSLSRSFAQVLRCMCPPSPPAQTDAALCLSCGGSA